MGTHIFRKTYRFLSFGIAIGLCLFLTDIACGETDASDIPITMKADQRPLGEVLDRIAETTGQQITIDDDWLDFTVSIDVKSMPLHRVLKRLLGDSNNAIVYGSDGTIKIFTYSESPSRDDDSTESPAMNPASMSLNRQDDTDRQPDMPETRADSPEAEPSESTENNVEAEQEPERAEEDSQEKEAEPEGDEKGDDETSSESAEQAQETQEEDTEQNDSGPASESENSPSE